MGNNVLPTTISVTQTLDLMLGMCLKHIVERTEKKECYNNQSKLGAYTYSLPTLIY